MHATSAFRSTRASADLARPSTHLGDPNAELARLSADFGVPNAGLARQDWGLAEGAPGHPGYRH
ncbi:hypothetical protein BAY61_14925 [Prauserella marina]|nr:hypothetical protein BAY61_14925 [Prauserella marina]